MVQYDTQALLPWLETVSVTSKRPNSSDVTKTGVQAGCYTKETAEKAASNGAYVRRPATFSVELSALGFDPKPGDTVTYESQTYTVLEAERSKFLKFWRLGTVALILAPDRRATCDILRPAPTNTGGMRQANLAALAEDVPCVLQPEETRGLPDDTGKFLTETRLFLYLGERIVLQAGDVAEVDGVRYECGDQIGLDRLDELPRCEVTRIG